MAQNLLKEWKEEATQITNPLSGKSRNAVLSPALQECVGERVKSIMRDRYQWHMSTWLSEDVLDADWAEPLENQGFSHDEIDAAFAALQKELVFAYPEFIRMKETPLHGAVAQERNRQLHTLRHAMIAFANMVYGT